MIIWTAPKRRRTRTLRNAIVASGFAILLAGCATPERKITPLFRDEPPTVTEPAPATPSTETRPEPKPVVIEPSEVRPAVTQPLTGWVSLHDWCAQNKIAPPTIAADAAQTNIVVRSEKGVFTFEPPRRNARWNGTLIGVGFAPQIGNPKILVNAIDLYKVLQPLLLTNTPPRKQGGIVVIDAGHGGANEGTSSRDRKFKEKDLTLDWAKRVEKLLHGSAWQVFMTRTTDIDLTLTQRVAFAEMKKADLFISLHFNSFSNANEAGLETYCITPQGMASHLTRGYPDEMDVSAPNNEFDIENLLLAHDLHSAILRKTGRKDRGIRRARFMTVLRDQKRPSVLVEGGYLSNPAEAKLIATEEYRQKLAEAVAEALGVNPPILTSQIK